MRYGMLVSIAGFTFGIAFRSFFDFGVSFGFFLILLGAAVGILFFLERIAVTNSRKVSSFSFSPQKVPFQNPVPSPSHFEKDFLRRNDASLAFFFGLFLIAAGTGILRFETAENPARAHALDAYIGKTATIEGIVSDKPDIRETHTKLTVTVLGLAPRQGEQSEKVKKTGVRVVVAHYPEFRYGDTVRIRGELRKPSRAIRDEEGAERPFNYSAYLAKDGIFYEMLYPRAELVASGGGSALKRALFSLKQGYLQGLHAALPEPHASLAGGITVGAKEALGKELLDMFRTAGIIHIVVLSGYNITIVARVIERAFAFLPRMFGLGISATTIILFAVMTGAGATIVRASLMALLVLLARATGRVSEITAALFIAAFFMLLHNPHILVFDPSFQLSFLATLGLLYAAPVAARFFQWFPAVWGIREAATATLATQVFVLPALVYMMGEFSVVAFLVNILILPLMPLSMLFSFLAAITNVFPAIIAAPFSYIAWMFLEYALGVSNFFASLPFAAVAVPSVYLWFVVAVYLFLIGIFARILHPKSKIT